MCFEKVVHEKTRFFEKGEIALTLAGCSRMRVGEGSHEKIKYGKWEKLLKNKCRKNMQKTCEDRQKSHPKSADPCGLRVRVAEQKGGSLPPPYPPPPWATFSQPLSRSAWTAQNSDPFGLNSKILPRGVLVLWVPFWPTWRFEQLMSDPFDVYSSTSVSHMLYEARPTYKLPESIALSWAELAR